LLGGHHGRHKHGCLVRRQRQLAMPHRLAPGKEMLRANLMPACHLRHDRPRRKRFRDDPSLVLVTPPPPATNATANLDAPSRRGSVNYMVDHICEPMPSTGSHLRTYAARCKMRAKHRLRGIWPAEWLCEALGVSRGGLYAWVTRPRSQRSRSDEELGAKVRASFVASERTYGARRVWKDMLAEGLSCGLHRIERLMRLQALKARPRRRRLPPDLGERQATAVAPNVLDRTFEAPAPNRKWIADFTYAWTAEGWLYGRCC